MKLKPSTIKDIAAVISVCVVIGGGIIDVIRRQENAKVLLNEVKKMQEEDHKVLQSLQLDMRELQTILKDKKLVLIPSDKDGTIN